MTITTEPFTPAEELEIIPVESPFTGDARRRILLRAVELVDERGARTGTDGMIEAGPYCLLGAVNAGARALGFDVPQHIPDGDDDYFFAARVLDGVDVEAHDPNYSWSADDVNTYDQSSSYYSWSDRNVRKRGKDAVIEALHKAANRETFLPTYLPGFNPVEDF